MPIAPALLFAQTGLHVDGTVRWGHLPKTNAPGVYAISLCADPVMNSGFTPRAPIDHAKVAAWIARVPTFTFRDRLNPDPHCVTQFLSEFWLSDESIVYIGKATCLHERLAAFRRHCLGNRSPHAGGHWLKVLSNLDCLSIHYCTCTSVEFAKAKENQALAIFKGQVSAEIRSRIANPIPFANRAHPEGNSKQNGIRNDVLP